MELLEFLLGTTFVSLLLILLLLFLFEISLFLSGCFWAKRVQLEGHKIEVLARDGIPQPGGKIYPDTQVIRITIALILRGRESFQQFTLGVLLRNHTVGKQTLVEIAVKDLSEGRMEVCIPLDVTQITAAPGTWNGRICIGCLGACLDKFEIEVPWCRSDLIGSLNVKCLETHVFKEPNRRETASFAHMSVCPSVSVFLQLKPHDWPLEKYTMPLWGCAVHSSTNKLLMLDSTWLTPKGDVLEARIPCNAVMNTDGEWKMEIGVEKKTLGTKRFSVISASRMNLSITVESCDVNMLNSQSQVCPLGNMIYANEILSLQTTLLLATPFPSALVEYSVRLSATVGKKMIFDQAVDYILSSARTTVILPEIPTAALLSNGMANSGTLGIRLNSRHLVRKRFLLRESIPPFAQIEGLLLVEEATRAQYGNQTPEEIINNPKPFLR